MIEAPKSAETMSLAVAIDSTSGSTIRTMAAVGGVADNDTVVAAPLNDDPFVAATLQRTVALEGERATERFVLETEPSVTVVDAAGKRANATVGPIRVVESVDVDGGE